MGGVSTAFIEDKLDDELSMRGLPASRKMFDRLSHDQQERFISLMNERDDNGKLKILAYASEMSTHHAGEGMSMSSRVILCVDYFIDVYNMVLTDRWGL